MFPRMERQAASLTWIFNYIKKNTDRKTGWNTLKGIHLFFHNKNKKVTNFYKMYVNIIRIIIRQIGEEDGIWLPKGYNNPMQNY